MKKDVKKISQEKEEEEEQNRYLEALQQQLDAEKEESPSSSTPVPSNQEDPLEAYRDTFLELSGELEAVTPTNPSEPTTFRRISDKDEATLIAGVAVELTKAPSPGKGDVEVELLHPPLLENRRLSIKNEPATPPSSPVDALLNPSSKAVDPDKAVEGT